jgi:Ca2+-binding RTX toxin-like protein
MTTPTPWGLTPTDLDGFSVNRPNGGAPPAPDGAQSAPAVADNHGGEQFAVVYLADDAEGASRVHFRAFDGALGQMTEVLTGPLVLDDGDGEIGEVSVVGIGDGFAAVWQETRTVETPDGPVEEILLKGRGTGPVGFLGGEFEVSAALTGDAAPHSLALSFYAKVLGPDPADPEVDLEAVGFTAAWVEGAAGTPGIIRLQRFQVVTNELGDPVGIATAGLDGEAGLGASDAPVTVPGLGRDPSVAALPDGETVVVWVDAANILRGRVYGPDGNQLVDLLFDQTVPPGGLARVVALEEGGFGVFWASGTDSLVIKGQIFTPNGEPATAWAPGSVQGEDGRPPLAALPPGHDGRFTVNNFGGEGDPGAIITYQAGGSVFALHVDGATGARVGGVATTSIGTLGGDHGVAGLLGGRAVVVGTKPSDDLDTPDAGGDVFAQIIDTRNGAGAAIVGDRDRGTGRVDARPDILIGTAGSDFIIADRGDARRGGSADDHVIAAMGDDTVYGGGGADILDGGHGTDLALYRAGRNAYSITLNGDGSYTVKDMRGGVDPGADGQGTIVGVESLAFNTVVPTTFPAGGTPSSFSIAPPTLRVSTEIFAYDLPEAQTDGTPIGWAAERSGLNARGAIAAPVAGATDPVSASAVGLLGGYAVVWESGGSVFASVFDPLGRPDAEFGGGAPVLRLDQGPQDVGNLTAAMAGDAGIVAVWEEAGTVKGRFASSANGVDPLAVGGEFAVGAPGAGQVNHQAQVAGYETVTAANDTQELGFTVVYTRAATGPGGAPVAEGEIWLERFTLYSAPVDVGRDLETQGERAPAPVGLDGRPGGAIRLTEADHLGRDAALSVLHDGEIVVAWIEGASVKVKMLRPAIDADGYVVYSPVALDLPDISVQDGTTIEIVGLGLNFAIGYLDAGGQYRAQLFLPDGDGYEPGAVANFAPFRAAMTGERHLVATDLDGTSFAMLVQNAETGVVRGQLFAVAGGEGGPPGQPGALIEVGGAFTAFQPRAGAWDGGGFSAAGLDDGRVLVTAAGETAVLAGLYDTRVPGEQIIGPRDGAPADLLVGTVGDDVIDGRVLEDELHGGLGNDLLLGGSEDDLLDGGEGRDTLLGGSEDDTLLGGVGDDLLLGGFGADSIDGSEGRDTVSYRGEFARFLIDLGAPVQTARSSRDPATGAILPNGTLGAEDTLLSIEDAIGGEEGDTIRGSAGSNSLDGGAGNDVLEGGAGRDDLAGGLGADSLFGGDGIDTLLGGNGDDLLDGGGGRDILDGGAGNDTYVVNGPGDTVVEAEGGGTDLVRSAATFTLDTVELTHVEHLTLTGTLRANGTGNALDNILTGNANANLLRGGQGRDTLDGGEGGDTLDGGEGADSLAGNLGNDTYIVDDAGDVILDTGGVDTVRTTLSAYTLGADIERLIHTGTEDFSGTGNAGNNLIQGGSGNDVLDGAGGRDTFLFEAGFGQDTVIGFDADPADGQDRLDIAALGVTAADFAGAVEILDQGDDVVIRIGADSITLLAVAREDVGIADFILA